jgi:hypothetical protein
MTSQSPQPPQAPLGAAQTASLLDHVIYEQVLACIDLDALYHLEQSLTMLAGDLDGVSADAAAELAKAMLDRALLHLPDDMRRYLRAARWPFEGCELCEEEARQPGRTGGRHHTIRSRS